MRFSKQSYKGWFTDVAMDSRLYESLKRIGNFLDSRGAVSYKILNSPKPLILEHWKSDKFEQIKVIIDGATYQIVRGGKYTLESGSTRKGMIPNLHLNEITAPNKGFKPPNIGFIADAGYSQFFLRVGTSSAFPGTGCEGTANCTDYTFLDSSNGNLATARYDTGGQVISIDGMGYGNVARKFFMNGDGVTYEEMDNGKPKAKATWKRTKTENVDLPVKSLRDFVPTWADYVSLESKPGTSSGSSLADVKDIDAVPKKSAPISVASPSPPGVSAMPTTNLLVLGALAVVVCGLLVVAVGRFGRSSRPN
jgi:hypothetical protein